MDSKHAQSERHEGWPHNKCSVPQSHACQRTGNSPHTQLSQSPPTTCPVLQGTVGLQLRTLPTRANSIRDSRKPDARPSCPLTHCSSKSSYHVVTPPDHRQEGAGLFPQAFGNSPPAETDTAACCFLQARGYVIDPAPFADRTCKMELSWTSPVPTRCPLAGVRI